MTEKLINEEYKIWKKTSPLLYDLLYTYACDSPPLTAKWMNNYEVDKTSENEEFINANILMGTNAKEGQNHVKLVSVSLPPTLSQSYKNESSVKIPNSLLKSRQLKIVREWNHPGEVNKLQINQSNTLFVTHTNTGDILLYDIKDKESKTHKSTLKFHTKEGFGLEWNPNSSKENQLVSCSEDCKIALWDINNGSMSKEIKPLQVIGSHESIVNDVSWNASIDSIFASVSDDSSYQIHDLRLPSGPIIHIIDAHNDPDSESNLNYPINSVDFNKTVPSVFATGGSDNSIQIWDLRNPSIPVRRLIGHKAPVVGLKFHENYLLSSSTDHRAMIWDLNKLDAGEPDKRRADSVDPCLSFMHGGHTGKVTDADWHPTLSNLVVTGGEDGLLEVWKPAHLDDVYFDSDSSQ